MKLLPRLSLCRRFCFGLTILLIAISGFAQTPAFPGALGFGQYATGGRNGTVYHVTTLADSGAGSFRDAVSQGNRTIVFDVGGTITLASAVSCSSSLTIAGQTAPGGGIALIGHEISFSVLTNEIVRFLRIRPGSLAASTEDGINMGDGTNMIFDHISIEFAPYNNIDAHGNYTGGNQLTIQNSILADPIGQQFNAHTEALNNTFTWCYDILSSAHNRNPLAKVNTVFVNNVVYNFQAGYTVANTSGNFSHDIINNYFITGPSTTSPGDDFFQMDANQQIYSAGNLLDSSANGTLTGSATAPGGVGVLSAPWSPVTTNIPTFSTATAYRYDASMSGALPRDQVDQAVFNDVASLGSSGQMWTSQTATGLGNNGYGTINGAVAPINTSGDGIADYWKLAFGMNVAVAYPLTNSPDGYTPLEHYLNYLAAPHVFTVTNTPVSVDLWQYTGGFTNVSPVYTVNALSNGVVTLVSGHIAQFVPVANYSGLGGFQFSVIANDGTGYTNNVGVLMSPVTPPSNLVWQGDGTTNLWGAGLGTNWLNGTNLVAFSSGDNVTFDDTGSNTPAINLSGPIVAGTVYALADEQNYTFGGNGYLSAGTALFKTGAAQLTLDTTNTASGGVTINEGIVQIGDGVLFNGNLSGNVTNNDTLIYATPGTLTSSVNISGSGTVAETGPGSLTLNGTQTYTGLTTVTAGALTFSGTLPSGDITNNGSLTLAPAATQTYTDVLSGSGAVTVNASAYLYLTGTNQFSGNLTNNGGFLVLSNNQAAGSGTVVYNGGYVVVGNGITITNNFSIPGSAANDLCMMATNTGTGIWAGNVSIGGSGQWRPGSDGGTLEFLGSAVMGSHIFLVPRGAMIFASNAVVSSTTSGFLGRDNSANKRSLNLTVRDNASVAMAGCSLGGGKTGGSVTITVQNNAVLNLGSSVDLHNIANAAAVSTLRLNGGTFIVGGFTKTDASYTNVIDFNGGTLKAYAGNTAFLPAFTASTSSNIVQTGGAIIDDGGFAITIAAVLLHDPSLGGAPDGGLTKLDTGTLTLTAGETYTGPTLVNAGTLALSGSGAIAGSTNVYIGSGALFDVSGTTVVGFTLGSGRTLWGNGSVNGNFTVGSGAMLAPGGNSIGALTFNNALTLAAGCTNVFAVSHSPLTNDAANVSGALVENGTLIITNPGGNALAAGDSFKLFNAAGYSGTFANVILPPLNAGLAWNTDALNAAGVVSVVSTAPATPPAFGSFSVSDGSLLFSGSNGTPAAGFYLLTTTNLTTPLTNWTRLLTNQFDGHGNFNFTNPAGSNAAGFYRLQLQ